MAETTEPQTIFTPDEPDRDAQHAAVLTAAATNLDTLRDQVASLQDSKYDSLIEILDSAHAEMQRLRGL